MKTLTTVIFICLAHLALAQSEVIKKSYPFTGQKLDLDIDFGSNVEISSWEKNEISIEVTYSINDGEQNELMNFSIDNAASLLEVKIDVDEKQSNYANECCCNQQNISYSNKGKRGTQLCADIKVKVFLPKQSDIKVKTILPNVTLVGLTGNLEIETVTGDIDLTWSESLGASISLNSVTGDIFTNFDLVNQNEKGLPLISGHKVETDYKKGGARIQLKTVTSDIYFRKAAL